MCGCRPGSYVTGGVWQRIDVEPCRVGRPSSACTRNPRARDSRARGCAAWRRLASSVAFACGALRLALLGALRLGRARPGGGVQPRGVGPVGGGADDLVALLVRSRVEVRDPGVERAGRAGVEAFGAHLHEHRFGDAPVRAVAGALVKLVAQLVEGVLELFERFAGEAAA